MRRARLAEALAAGLLLAGCAGGGTPAASGPTSSSTSTSAKPDPVRVCADAIEYWAGEYLAGHSNDYDYQEMALTSAQYEALLAVVDQAQRLGAGRPANFVHDEAARRCVDVVKADAAASGTGWP